MNDPSKQIVNWKNVSTIEEKIAELETNCKAMTAEIEKLKTELAEKVKNEKVWQPKIFYKYMYIDSFGDVCDTILYNSTLDDNRANFNNVYQANSKTQEHLNWYANNVLRVQNKLMQLHELLCPDYFPNWENNNEIKFYLYYNYGTDIWYYDYRYTERNNVVYFTKEAAEKACEILNKEKFMMK